MGPPQGVHPHPPSFPQEDNSDRVVKSGNTKLHFTWEQEIQDVERVDFIDIVDSQVILSLNKMHCGHMSSLRQNHLKFSLEM